MKRLVFLSLIFGFVFALVGCSGSGGLSSNNTIRENIGTAPPNVILEKAELIFRTRNNFVFEQRQGAGDPLATAASQQDIQLETRWKEMPLLEDERALGLQAVRVRFFLSAHLRNQTTNVMSVRVMLEHEARLGGAVDWEEAPISALRRRELRDMINELKAEIATGIRF